MVDRSEMIRLVAEFLPRLPNASRALQIVVHGYRVPARRGVLAGSAF